MARVVEYYVEGEERGREWSGREEGVGEVREWKRGWRGRDEGLGDGVV